MDENVNFNCKYVDYLFFNCEYSMGIEGSLFTHIYLLCTLKSLNC